MVAVSSRRAAPAIRVIFLGPPGAGKGTQAAMLAGLLSVPKISTGDMLRDAIAEGTPLGKRAQPAMERGNLAPDDVLLEMVRERIAESDCARGFVFDGFPRTLPQAEGLAAMDEAGADVKGFVVFDFEVPREELMRRLSGRRWCPACQTTYHLTSHPPQRPGVCDLDGVLLEQREDDREDVIAERLREYDARTLPLVAYYRERARLVPVDGNRAKDVVLRDLLDAVGVRA